MEVLLKDGTCGSIDFDAKEGEIVTVSLSDENGNFIEVEGEILEIL